MDVIPASQDHIEIIQDAFARQRKQRAQEHADYLAQPEIADFHSQRLCQNLERSDHSPFDLYIEKNRLIAISSASLSEWHTDHFNLPYYKVQPFYCFTNETSSINSFVHIWNNMLKKDDLAVYTLRLGGHQSQLAYALQTIGGRHVGVSTRMILHKSKIIVDIISSDQYYFEKIREFKDEDLTAIKRIGAENHSHSHFFNDSRLDPSVVHAIFAKWLEKCAGGVANKILIAEHQNRPVGFATLLTSNALYKTLGKRIGIIDFIVADHSLHGMGVGAALLRASLEWFNEQVDWIELRTMADNVRAIRFYQKYGFRLLSSDHHFHLWSDDLKK